MHGVRRGYASRVPDDDQTRREFADAVNMTPHELKQWLGTEASRVVGGAPAGQASGRRIVTLLSKRRGSLTDDDLAHMRKVVGHVHRHLARRPSGDVTDTRWRHTLMNWGHDPLR